MIHQYINNGYYIVMDVNSGSVHSVDPVFYDAVQVLAEEAKIPDMEKPEKLPEEAVTLVKERLSGKYPDTEVAEVLEDIQELIDMEQLFTEDIYKEYVADFKKRKTVVKALCLHIAHDCNLACRYCFAEEGEYHGRRGSVHSVDPVFYDAVQVLAEEAKIPDMEKPEKLPKEAVTLVRERLSGKYPDAEVAEVLEDIQELIDMEQLFTEDIYKEYVADFKKRKTVVKALCLHIAHDCNLACRYCFAEEGEYHGRRALMSYEVSG